MEKRTSKGKQKIEMKLMEAEEARAATFSRRKKTLFEKAGELSTLTGADVAVLLISPSGKPYSYGSTSIEEVIDKYRELKSVDRRRDHADVGISGDHADVGKSNVSEAFDDHLSLAVELPANTTCLMDCEAAEILQGIQENMVVLSDDPAIKLPVSFDRGLAYAQRNRLYDNPLAVKQILEPLKQHGVSDGELCMIANFPLESVDEVFALVPSFKNKKSKLRVPLENVLSELAKLRKAA